MEHDQSLSAQARDHQLRMAEMCYRKERLVAGADVEEAALKRRERALKHEASMARLRNDPEAERSAYYPETRRIGSTSHCL